MCADSSLCLFQCFRLWQRGRPLLCNAPESSGSSLAVVGPMAQSLLREGARPRAENLNRPGPA